MPFPFSDLTDTKNRPAIVLACIARNDVITCQISSRAYADPNAVVLDADAFTEGGLAVTSYAQCGKLFTANAALLGRSVGLVREPVVAQLVERVTQLLRGGR